MEPDHRLARARTALDDQQLFDVLTDYLVLGPLDGADDVGELTDGANVVRRAIGAVALASVARSLTSRSPSP